MRDGVSQTDCECRPAVFFHTFYTDEGFESLGYCSTYWGTISTPNLQ